MKKQNKTKNNHPVIGNKLVLLIRICSPCDLHGCAQYEAHTLIKNPELILQQAH